MKIAVEYNVLEDGRKFLNYWNWLNGDDVVCEIIDGKLMLAQYDDNANELPSKEISYQEFLQLVEDKAPAS